MADEVSDATRLVRQTFERLIREYPRATDAQLSNCWRAARADGELKDAAFAWTGPDMICKLRARVRRPLRKSR